MTRTACGILCLLVFGSAAPACAQITPEQCGVLARSASGMATATGDVLDLLKQSAIGPRTLQAVAGDLLTAAQKANATRAELEAAMTAYLTALQDYAYELQVCSRG